ncbi:hypothetical protein DFR75_11713 [Nocardia ignorata]|uniref:Uncharacterized protein n=2 Tax=Nocardia ignorata TaxID=145285 RepID=A0A4R6P1Z4_NOCIG|nr:hypothetical protein DFR75_11713 [Nocardia ignorata]
MLSVAPYQRQANHSLRDVAVRLVIPKGKKNAQHPSPVAAMRSLRDHDQQTAPSRTMLSVGLTNLPVVTLLISMFTHDEITVVMDTFATNSPLGAHSTKWRAPAGAKFIVAGTGLADIVEPWLAAITADPNRSVAAVIAEAERILPKRWRRLAEQVGQEQLAPTTAWTYFFDSTGRATRVSVSSRSNFACETMTQQGTLIRPEVPVGQFRSFDGSDAEFLRLARHVARYCTEQPELVDDVAVGGEAVMIRLPASGAAVTRRLGRLG